MKICSGTTLLRLLAWLTAAAAASCTPNRPYHTSRPVTDGSAPSPSSRQPANGSPVQIVELDEQGDPWDRRQLDQAVAGIRASKKAPLVITYVHGWRHDATPDDTDLQMFRTFLDQLQTSSPQMRKFQVHGVYVGWRGASVHEAKMLKGLNILWAGPTFFGRRLQTDRIARVPLTNTLLRLTQASRQHKLKGKSVIVGHSFGARVVEQAMAQAIVTQSALSAPGQPMAMPADLIFLINQASESLTARQLKIALINWPKGTPPAIVAMTSATDYATGNYWPIGLNAATALGAGGGMRDYPMPPPHKPDPQRSYYTTTTGHDPRQISHRVHEIDPSRPSAVEVTENGNVSGKVILRFGRDSTSPPQWELRKIIGNEGTTFVIDSDAYWVVSLPKSVLDGHTGKPAEGGIFNGTTAELMSNLVKYAVPKAGQPSKSAPAPATASDVNKAVMQSDTKTFTR